MKKNIKQIKKELNLTDAGIAEMFGYKSSMSYANSSGKKHIEAGIEAIYNLMHVPQRFVINNGSRQNYWVVTDTTNNIVVEFKHKNFDSTQRVTELYDVKPDDYMTIARHLREVSEWLALNHPDKV